MAAPLPFGGIVASPLSSLRRDSQIDATLSLAVHQRTHRLARAHTPSCRRGVPSYMSPVHSLSLPTLYCLLCVILAPLHFLRVEKAAEVANPQTTTQSHSIPPQVSAPYPVRLPTFASPPKRPFHAPSAFPSLSSPLPCNTRSVSDTPSPVHPSPSNHHSQWT